MVTPLSERSPQTPPVLTFLTTWRLDPVALVALVLAGAIYAGAVVRLRRRGHRWPMARTLAFFVLGLGSYAWVSFGFLGAYSTELRWAFTTRIALLLFAVPALVTLGKPVALTRIVLKGMPLRMLNAALGSWPARLFGNAIFAPLFACAAFLVFLTPTAAVLRDDTYAQWGITILVPLAGLLMVLPIGEHTMHRTSLFITAEFLFAFVEMVLDAIPGILLRLNDSVLDHAAPVIGSLPTWFPNPLHDQHLSGDFLWFIAEIVDVPVLVVLFIRWTRTDRREAKQLDDLSDEEMEALTLAHLRGGR
ncbi:MAG: putative rane protein [Microbacteriaceae bacterium]|jgi:cytochrome c oxidase assembly factor CtaG|nr:putative rane protein [Microbacteriaceae bacterium]